MNIDNILDNYKVHGSYVSRKTARSSDFAEQLKSRAEETVNADSLCLSGEVKKNDLSMEKYKLDIYQRISKLTGGCRRSKNITSVYISDEGFEAMRNDPEYEKWVMSQIKGSVSCRGFGNQERKVYSVICIGASKEECNIDCWTDVTATKEEYEQIKEIRRKRLKSLQKASLEKYAKYRKALQENAIKKSRMEIEHIKGNYDDLIYRQKNLSSESHVSKLFLYWK